MFEASHSRVLEEQAGTRVDLEAQLPLDKVLG